MSDVFQNISDVVNNMSDIFKNMNDKRSMLDDLQKMPDKQPNVLMKNIIEWMNARMRKWMSKWIIEKCTTREF